MPTIRRARRTTTTRRRMGRGFFDSIKRIFTGSKAISSLAPIIGAATGNPMLGATIGGIAGNIGMGRRRRRAPARRAPARRRTGGRLLGGRYPVVGLGRKRRAAPKRRTRTGGRAGGSFLSKLKSIVGMAHRAVKSNALVSRGLNHFGYSKLGNAARALGYGRRRAAPRRRRR